MIITVVAQDKTGGGFKTEVAGIGTNAMTFLEIGVGSRALGMGNAYAAVANDASSLYWNPAGMVWVKNMELEVSHNDWFLDSRYQYIAGVFPIPSIGSAVGISFSTIGFDDQPVRTVNRPEGTGEYYDARDFALGLSFASAITDRFSFGLTAKYLSSQIWHETASAFAMDMGIFYNTQLDGLRLGFSMSNFGTEVKYEGRDIHTTVDPEKEVNNFDRVPAQYLTSSYPLPLLFRAGISYGVELGKFGSTLLAVDLLHPSNAPEAVNVGMEYVAFGMFTIRGGYQSLFDDTAEGGLTLGAGIDYYNSYDGYGIRFDYAWNEWGMLKNTQSFSVGLLF